MLKPEHLGNSSVSEFIDGPNFLVVLLNVNNILKTKPVENGGAEAG